MQLQENIQPIQPQYIILRENTLHFSQNSNIILSPINYEIVFKLLKDSQIFVILILQEHQKIYGMGTFQFAKGLGKNEFKFATGIIIDLAYGQLAFKIKSQQVNRFIDQFILKKQKIQEYDIKQFYQLVQKFDFEANNIKIRKIQSMNIQPNTQNQENDIIWIQSPIIKQFKFVQTLKQSNFQNVQKASSNLQIYKRILRQVQEVNNDFFNLRTQVYPDPTGLINVFYYYMFPNDGPFCSLPLIGRIIISQTYPVNPPVFHLFTKTNRYNLDVFNSYINDMNSSSICFDISIQMEKVVYTSTVFASIMQVIVSISVDQMNGGAINQFVSMETLKSCYNNVHKQFVNRLQFLKSIPKIPAFKAYMIQQCKSFVFNDFQQKEYIFSNKNSQCSIISNPISLQKDYYTVKFDIINLTQQFVLSFVLTNNPQDLQGKQNKTILFRNGVTATAAKKMYNRPIKWFYHGKPLNRSKISLCLTVTPKQFCISYIDEFTDDWLIHGDTPVSVLKPEVIGSIEEDIQIKEKNFNLVIYVKKKNSSKNIFTLRKTDTTVGYIHKNTQFN